ncbi:E3 ubiquitin-protein ligase TRAIP-like [Cydia strobilella]|uniref:E3 ubiquitin-protein ligase TRAIP-like n=1 Tax=Cydia strobilella TaxID=1100964 RepID=UPI0030052483
MHILCTICSDLVNPAESLYVTKCGHLFHHQCLAQWIERSKSCPQCRNKVTDRCMFRMYPTVSNENSGEDAATLQSRLDDAMLQLRTQNTEQRELKDKLAAATQEANKKEELLKAAEKRLVSRDSAVSALREQLEYVKIQNKETQRLKEDNEALKKNIQTLNGLQKVLNATAAEVEETLQGYSDLRTLATFAAALKRALCESESKKRSCRELQHSAEQRLAAMRVRYEDLQAKIGQVQENLTNMERKYEALKHKRKASGEAEPRGAKHARPSPSPSPSPAPSPSTALSPAPAPAPAPACSTPRLSSTFNDAVVDIVNENEDSFNTAVRRIIQSDSPYLSLKQSGLALGTIHQRRPAPANLKPSEFAILRSAPTSIFHKPPPLEPPRDELNTAFTAPSPSPPPYDGLGGHARPDTFPTPRPKVPKVTSKHKLKRFNSAGSRDISQMFAGLRDKD